MNQARSRRRRTIAPNTSINTAIATIPSGDITGTPCEWTGTPSDLVTVEYMPEDLRASHRAAHNYGTYPHNGALRLHVTPACAERLTAGEDEADARIIDHTK